MALIIISGTPGTGKSVLAKALAKKLGLYRLDLSRHYAQISTRYNRMKQCYDVNVQKFRRLVRETIQEHPKGIIIDSHIAHLLPPRMVSVCIALTCPDLKKLERRLKKRGYSRKKIKENIQAELFQVCLEEAKEKGHRIIIIRNTSRGFPGIQKLFRITTTAKRG